MPYDMSDNRPSEMTIEEIVQLRETLTRRIKIARIIENLPQDHDIFHEIPELKDLCKHEQ